MAPVALLLHGVRRLGFLFSDDVESTQNFINQHEPVPHNSPVV